MRRRRTRRVAGAVILALLLAGATSAQDAVGVLDSSLLTVPDATLQQLLDLARRRGLDRRERDLLIDALGSALPGVRRLALRTAGQVGQHDLLPAIAPLLMDVLPAIRAEAAVALGLAARSLDQSAAPLTAATTITEAMRRDIGLAVKPLVARLGIESDPAVAGIICETLGLLPYAGSDDVRRAESVLVESLARFRSAHGMVGDTSAAAMGAAKGLAALIRLRRDIAGPSPATIKALREAVRVPLIEVTAPPEQARQRAAASTATFLRDAWADDARRRLPRYALQALMDAEQLDLDTLESAFGKPPVRPEDPGLRRLAVRAAGLRHAPPEAVDLLERVLDSASREPPAVIAEALLSYAPWRDQRGCGFYTRRVDGTPAAVSLTALDLLDGHCPIDDILPLLESVVGRLSTLGNPHGARPPFGDRIDHVNAWHQATRALVSLAKVDRQRAARRLPAFATHPVWHVRAVAARVAAMVNDGPRLEQLARDADPNVVTAAITALRTSRGHAADPFFIGALSRDDDLAVFTATRALQGSPAAAVAVPALLDAFDRFTEERRGTSRDVRLALLQRVQELGVGLDVGDRLSPHLEDVDPVVADQVARALTALTGEAADARPTVLPEPAVPTLATLQALSRATVVVTFKGWRGPTRITLRLLVEEAPQAVAAFAALVRARHYDGLTVHAVVPGERLVAGSPHANDLSGGREFVRDELGYRPHRRGTIGLATRGPDAGDLRLFVNLEDDERLDRAYTLLAVTGDDAWDGLLEGDEIESMQVVAR